MGDGTEPIDDDEYLYRRIPIGTEYFDPGKSGKPSPWAFHPRKYDETGISVSRAKYVTPEQLAQNDRQKRFYIAVLRAGDLRREGIRVVPRPLEGKPGHAELPDLTYDDRREDRVEEFKQLLANKLCREVLGPFP